MAAKKHPAERYCDDVLRGKIPACRTIRQACERYRRERKGGKVTPEATKRGLRFDQEAAEHAINFFSFLRHSKGRKWADKPFVLRPWQQFIVWNIFGWHRKDGTRRFRVAWVEVPKKNGKTTMAAGIALYLLIADGEPGAEIYSAATKKDQAKLVWTEASNMIRKSPELAKRCGIFRNNIHSGTSKFEAIGRDSDSAEGINPSGAIIDEIHVHKTRDMWDLMDNTMAAREQPLMFCITTAGWDRESIGYEQHDYATRVLDGLVRADDADSTFVYIAGLTREEREKDEHGWRKVKTWKAVNPNYGVSVQPDDMRRKCAKARQVPAEENSFRRYRLNEWTESSERFIHIAAWDVCPTDRLPADLLAGRPCFGGLDLSSTLDLSAFARVFAPYKDDPLWRVLLNFWVPKENMKRRSQTDRVPYDVWAKQGWIKPTAGDVIDYDVIREDIKAACEGLKMVEVGYDPYNATQICTQLMDDGFEMVPVRQGGLTLSPAVKHVQKLVLDHALNHSGNPVLRWCAGNMVVDVDANENFKPNKKKSSERIDGIVATIIAVVRAIANPAPKQSVYARRGILTIPRPGA